MLSEFVFSHVFAAGMVTLQPRMSRDSQPVGSEDSLKFFIILHELVWEKEATRRTPTRGPSLYDFCLLPRRILRHRKMAI